MASHKIQSNERGYNHGGNESKRFADCLLIPPDKEFVHCQNENVLSMTTETVKLSKLLRKSVSS